MHVQTESPIHHMTHSLTRGCPDFSRSSDCNWTGSTADFPNNFAQSLFLSLLNYIGLPWMNDWLTYGLNIKAEVDLQTDPLIQWTGVWQLTEKTETDNLSK
jgi:hypothetical protein